MEDRSVKQVLFRVSAGWILVRGGKVDTESKGERIWLMSFIHLYENRTIKPNVENFLQRREE
jgi:hypothetical protein